MNAAAVWRLDPDQPAQAVDEALRVCKLRATRIAPLRDEWFDIGSSPHTGTLGGQKRLPQHGMTRRQRLGGFFTRMNECLIQGSG